MTVHSFHIFDRKGKTLFTKRYIKTTTPTSEDEEEQLSEQRKLVFGMLFSLRELSASLSPSEGPGDLHLVKTGASTLYNFETVSGLRFCLYTTPESVNSVSSSNAQGSGGGGGPGSNLPGSVTPNSQGGPSSGGPGVSGGHTGGPTSTSGPGGSNSQKMTSPAITANIRAALKHIYEHIWVTFVVRSPMYRPDDPNLAATNFESSLDNYLKGMQWFRS